MAITHTKVSAKSDGGDSSQILPSDWNGAHTNGDLGLPLGLTGAVAPTRYVGGHATVPPTTGTFAVGDYVIIATGKIAVCTVAGTPGTWVTIADFDATAPAAIGTAGAGSAATVPHRDHVHPTGAGTPSTQAFGDSAATGTGPAAAMTDHKHAMPSDPFLAGVKHLVTFSKQGVVAVTTDTTALRFYNDTGRTLTFNAIRATALTGPSGTTQVIDINVDGTTIFTTTKVVLPDTTGAASTVLTTSGFATTTVATGHYVTMNVDATLATGLADLTVAIWVTG